MKDMAIYPTKLKVRFVRIIFTQFQYFYIRYYVEMNCQPSLSNSIFIFGFEIDRDTRCEPFTNQRFINVSISLRRFAQG